jgi:hypothetical protein
MPAWNALRLEAGTLRAERGALISLREVPEHLPRCEVCEATDGLDRDVSRPAP